MKQIQTPNEVFIKALGYQKPTSENKLRLLAYCLLQPVEEGVLLFNSLSCELLLLSNEEVNQMYDLDYLYQHWFLVPDSFNDKKFAIQFRGLYQLFVPKKNIINSYTILTTTDCNAHCFYCYELGRTRIPMSIETASKVADYIIDNYKKSMESDSDATVKILWFGGEPLFNNKVIYSICEKLSDADVKFKSHMVSNGYLFDEQLVADAKKLWNLKDVQITLDGTEKVYNKAKAFIYKGVNAYERVLNNIDLLLKAHIRVIVRMNIDVHNADDLLKLTGIISSRFGSSPGFSCYSHPLFETAGETSHIRSEQRREAVYRKQKQLVGLLEQRNLRRYGKVPTSIKPNHCMADGGEAVIISPNGDIGLCEHYSDSEFISHIDNPADVDKTVVKSFQERTEDVDICNDCAYYPQCVRLKKCPEGSLCFPQIKEQHIYELKKSMIVTYERWQKKQSDETSSDSEEIEDSININC